MPDTATTATFAVLGYPLTVMAEPETLHHLTLLLAPFTYSPAPDASGIQVMRAGHNWRVIFGAEQRQIGDNAALLRYLEWLICAQGVDHATGAGVMHAGAVMRDGAALLLPAMSGAGKTTLTLALAGSGWDLLTDDICPLEYSAAGVTVNSMPRCCHISAESHALLSRYAIALEGPIADVPEYYRAPVATNSGSARWIIFPRFAPHAPVELAPISQAECAAHLLQSLFANTNPDPQAKWRLALDLARQAPTYSLRFGDLGEAVDAIQRATGMIQ